MILMIIIIQVIIALNPRKPKENVLCISEGQQDLQLSKSVTNFINY